MSLSQSKPGKVYYGPSGVPNTLGELATRTYSQQSNSNDFFDRNKIVHGYLYENLQATLNSTAAPWFYVGPCNEITLQVIGTATLVVNGSLDGTTSVAANVVASADGFIRIQSKYRYLQVTVTAITNNPSVYFMVS